MRTRPHTAEVVYAAEPLITVSAADIAALKAQAAANARRRMRLCAHLAPDDPVHEMLIVHTSETYVRPHKHLAKIESFHVIEGQGEVVTFDDAGQIHQIVAIGEYASGRQFYYRLAEARFHTLLITSPILVFHETTNGPFRPEETAFAPWSPAEAEGAAWAQYLQQLRERAAQFTAESAGQP